jgi:hypothetical protein
MNILLRVLEKSVSQRTLASMPYPLVRLYGGLGGKIRWINNSRPSRADVQYSRANFDVQSKWWTSPETYIGTCPLRFREDEADVVRDECFTELTLRPIYSKFINYHGIPGDLKQMYLFGCAHGDTVRHYVTSFKREGLPLSHINLFDSFEGLPAEADGVPNIPLWGKGAFSWKGKKGMNSSDDLVRSLKDTLSRLAVPEGNFTIFKGFFSNTLTEELVHNGTLLPAILIDIDCDLYISTFEALDFMFLHKLARAGTFINYDDWYCTRVWESGESRAHLEIQRKYNVKFCEVTSWGEYPIGNKLFAVHSVDSPQ